MYSHFYILFIFFGILIIIKSLDTEEIKNITVPHTILEQEKLYRKSHYISNSFIDFTKYRIYKIDKDRIYHSDGEMKFKLNWDNGDELTIGCITEKQYKCSKIDLKEHTFISFDYDRLIGFLGGIFSYLLILFGIFCLTSGYIYFNLSIIFYGSFGFILLSREICELMELYGHLNIEDDQSKDFLWAVFCLSLFVCILYGLVCYHSKYLKYITFGFINGLFISKIAFFFTIIFVEKELKLIYIILESIITFITMIFFIFIQNKSPIFSIFSLINIASYGIVFGFNILFGGIPFIPYLILIKEFMNEINESSLFKDLIDVKLLLFYVVSFLLMLCFGIYRNNENYKAITSKIKSK